MHMYLSNESYVGTNHFPIELLFEQHGNTSLLVYLFPLHWVTLSPRRRNRRMTQIRCKVLSCNGSCAKCVCFLFLFVLPGFRSAYFLRSKLRTTAPTATHSLFSGIVCARKTGARLQGTVLRRVHTYVRTNAHTNKAQGIIITCCSLAFRN